MDLGEKLQSVPDQPGAYLIKDSEGNILYVGKASSLRKRLRQHFRDEPKGGPWHHIMISRATDFDFILARSDLEALILEANLIKEHHPQFNVQYQDNRRAISPADAGARSAQGRPTGLGSRHPPWLPRPQAPGGSLPEQRQALRPLPQR